VVRDRVSEPATRHRGTDLLVTLANCEKARSFSIHDRCKARFEGFSFRA
jgi:hypothetical protein